MAAFVHQESRPLKKPRLGCPDVYPQDPKQKEDELTTTNVKQGFNNHPTFQDEYGTARFSHINQQKFGAYFSAIVAEKQKVNTFLHDTGKKKQQVSKDNYWLVTPTTKSRAALQAWFQDLAGSKPLVHLAKKVPMFNKKEENQIFSTLCDHMVPMVRAAWYLKMTAAISATMAETKTMKRRAPMDPSQEYCTILCKFLKEQLNRVMEYHHNLTQATNTALQAGLCSQSIQAPAPSQEEQKAIKLWQFTTRLTRYIYQEGMLECHEFLSWLVEIMEKIKAHDDHTLRFVLPLVTQFLEEFVKSQMLSRRLAYVCARRLMAMFNEACSNSPPPHSPHAMGNNSANFNMQPGQQGQPHTLASVFAEYMGCPQHRSIILGLCCILQTITLRCASALVWINVGEAKNTSVPGSPLDILPCAASQLPLPGQPSLHHHQIRATLRHAEHQIKLRSRAAEVRWSSDKCQESTAGHTISRVLYTLEVLDRHSFDRVDANNSLDALYNKIFCGPQSKDANEFPLADDPTILLLCEWAVCPQRSGEHRALVVAHLLERRIMDLEAEKEADVENVSPSSVPPAAGGDDKDQQQQQQQQQQSQQQTPPPHGMAPVGPSAMPMPQATPIFQGLLLYFLDTQAPVIDEHSSGEEKKSFSNLVLLFSELIRCDVFSHDSYMCTLISRGDIANTTPSGPQASAPPSVEQPGSVKDKEDAPTIKEEPKEEPMEIKQEPEDDSNPDNFDEFDTKPPPVPAARKESTSFQDKFLEAIKAKNLAAQSESEYFDEDKYSPHEKKPNTTSRSPTHMKVNRHLMYAKNFPIPQDDMSAHECNQRSVLLYGFGRGRDEARHSIKKVQKDIVKLVVRGKKDSPSPGEKVESSKSAKRIKVEFASNVETLRVMEKFEGLTHFDQHIVVAMVGRGLLEGVESCSKGNIEHLPPIEQITLAFDMMENALSINQLLDFAFQLLNFMHAVENELASKSSSLAGNYTTNLCLCIVAMLRRYQACLLVSLEQTANVFELLCGVVQHVTNVTSCSSAERCILAYLYDLYISCSHLRNKFSELFSSVASKVKQTIYTSITPSESNVRCNFDLLVDYIENPNRKPLQHAAVGRQLNDSSNDRYSFVCNALLHICGTSNLDQINDTSILCAELTATCNSLSSEWLGVLKALCCSMPAHHSCGFNDLLLRVEVSDLSIHDSIAVFTSILIARHCFSLEDVVEHVALASLIAATPSVAGGTLMDPDAEPGARLMCHLLLRLFWASNHAIMPSESSGGSRIIKSSCNQRLLAAAHRSISVEALLGVLKALLLLGDAGLGNSNGSGAEDEEQPSTGGGSAAMKSASLSEYARYTLKTICSQEWVREIFLKDPEKLWTPEVLLDEVLTCKQAQHLLQLICYPSGVPAVEHTSDNEQKQTITRILRTLDQWGLRVSWLELQLMLKQRSQEDGSPSSLLDNIAKAAIEVFQQQTEDSDDRNGSNNGSNGRRQTRQQQRTEQERSGVWFVAPLVSKLHSSVQGRVLRAAGNVLESVGQTWSTKGSKDKEKGKSQMSMVNHQPLLSLILTCLKGQDEQREGLLTSLQTQLTQFLQSPKDDRWEDQKSRRMMHEALQLRLSLVGNMFDTILRSNQWTTEFALLLLQLITTGTVDIHSNSELFTTVLDMLSVLINSTLNSDAGASPGSGEEKGRQHQTLIKKLKKELGDKHSDGIDRVRQLLPVPKKPCEVITCEPMGVLVDSKGNKIAGFDSIDKKQGLQVASKQKVNPWDTLEANKNPAPLSWSWFGAVRMERKPLKYQEQHRMTLYHTHGRQKDDDYFFGPPVLPPDEEEPPQPVPQEPEKPPQEVPVSQENKMDSSSSSGPEAPVNQPTTKKRKRPRRKNSTPTTPVTHMREPFPFNPNMNFPGGERPFMQPQQQYGMPNQFPYQQPLPPAGPSRGIPEQRPMAANSKVALRNLLNTKNPGQMHPMQMQDSRLGESLKNKAKYQLMHKRMLTEKIRQRTANIGDGNPGMFQGGYNRRPQEGPMGHMQPGGQPPTSSYSNYGNQMMQQPPMQEPGGTMMSTNSNPYYGNHPPQGQGGMMQPGMGGQPQPGYMQQTRPMAATARLQQQLHQRANMQQQVPQQTMNQPGMPGTQGGQPYMTHQLTPQQQQERHRQLLQEQRYMGMQRQHPNQAQQLHQQQQTQDLVRQLQSQMPRGPSMGQPGPQPPQHPYQY